MLCVGDVCGRFDVLYARVKRLNESKHGPFDVLFCVGRAFSAQQKDIDKYMDGTKIAPIETYFITSEEDLPTCLNDIAEGGEICKNMVYLGQAGVKTVSQLKVAFLSGAYNEELFLKESKTEHPQQHYTDAHLAKLAKQATTPSFSGVDLLLTSEWGRGVHLNTAHTIQKDLSAVGSKVVSDIAVALKPRYHFCGTEG